MPTAWPLHGNDSNDFYDHDSVAFCFLVTMFFFKNLRWFLSIRGISGLAHIISQRCYFHSSYVWISVFCSAFWFILAFFLMLFLACVMGWLIWFCLHSLCHFYLFCFLWSMAWPFAFVNHLQLHQWYQQFFRKHDRLGGFIFLHIIHIFLLCRNLFTRHLLYSFFMRLSTYHEIGLTALWNSNK